MECALAPKKQPSQKQPRKTFISFKPAGDGGLFCFLPEMVGLDTAHPEAELAESPPIKTISVRPRDRLRWCFGEIAVVLLPISEFVR
jgi:hypothetical protein